MAGLDEKRVGTALERILPTEWVQHAARATGAVKRQRKVNVALFVWSLVLGFASSGGVRTIAAARRTYEDKSGDSIEESSYYDRFTAGMAKLMQECFNHALDSVRGSGKRIQRLKGALAKFADVVITDSSVVRLSKKLQDLFPGSRVNHSPAAMKLHTILNVKGSGINVSLSEGKKADVKAFRIGPWIAKKLLLFDLGYYSFNLFNRITRHGGYFVSRVKDNANPRVIGINPQHSDRDTPIVGKLLSEVLDQLTGDIIDIIVKVDFKNRAYAGKQRKAEAEFRVVGVRNPETKEFHLYFVNMAPDMVSAEEIAQLYRYRWEIELVFKEMKSYFHLEDVNTGNEHLLKALIYATLITWVIARAVRRMVIRALPKDKQGRVPARRFAAVFSTIAMGLLELMVRRLGVDIPHACRSINTLLNEAIDPNARRRSAFTGLSS